MQAAGDCVACPVFELLAKMSVSLPERFPNCIATGIYLPASISKPTK